MSAAAKIAAVLGLVSALAIGLSDTGSPVGGATAAETAPGPLKVYVVVLDGMRPGEVDESTPTLSALKAQGTWYEQARAVLPAETLPNHVAMMTGQLPEQNGVIANQWWPGTNSPTKSYMQLARHDLEADTLVTRLEKACATRGDIATATVMSKSYLYNVFSGEPKRAGDPFSQLEADHHYKTNYIPVDEHWPDAPVMDDFLQWTRRQPANLPQFAFLNLGDIDRAGHADLSGVSESVGGVAGFRQAAIVDTDKHVSLLVDELKKTGAWDETVMLVASDHGMDWSPQIQSVNIAGKLPGYTAAADPALGDYHYVDGAGTGLVYVHRDADIAPIARAIDAMPGVAFVATREPVPGLDNPTLKDTGIDHPKSPDIEVFVQPGWRFDSGTPTPGNHGHAITQHSLLFATGGHPALADVAKSIGGPQVYDTGVPEERRFVHPAGGPGNLSIAPTVAALFGIGDPQAGYARPPLAEAFDAGALERDSPLCGDAPALAAPPKTPLDVAPGPQAPGPLLTAGAEVESGSLREVTYELVARNSGGAAAENVTLAAPVPANTTFASSDAAPTDPAVCKDGAAAATACSWSVGTIPAGESRTVKATYRLADAASTYTVREALTVAGTGVPPDTDTDSSLVRRSEVLSRDAMVDGDAAETNFGGCNELRVSRGTRMGSLLTSTLPATLKRGHDKGIQRLFGVELVATATSSPYTAEQPGRLALDRVAPERWVEGTGGCAGAAGQGDDARAAKRPATKARAVATAPVAGEGPVRWDVTEQFHTFAERREFTGFELRDGGSSIPGDGIVTLASREAADAAKRPRLVAVYTDKNTTARCIDADAEAVTRPSDAQPRIGVVVTDGAQKVTVPGGDACSGTPLEGQEVLWEFDVEGPDLWFSNLHGTAVDRTRRTGAADGPNTAITVTDAAGRTFVGVRQGAPYAAGSNTGESRLAAILPKPDLEKGSYGTGCEPEAASGDGACTEARTGETMLEDDVHVTWTAATKPPDPDPDPDPDPPAGGDYGSGDNVHAGAGAAPDFATGRANVPSVPDVPKPGAISLARGASSSSGALPLRGRCANRLLASSSRVTGTAAGDRVRARRGGGLVRGLGGDDCLLGGPGRDRLYGGAGADELTGGGGRDVLDGGPGADRIRARDGQRDVVTCGSGRDRAEVDRLDRVSGCEVVRRR